MVEQSLVNEERSLELSQAKRQVDRFVHRFQPGYRSLTYYAALPLILTPELLHYLRVQFLRGEVVPWVAEVDLLLSDLCQPVGFEQYAMETVVRAYLLQEMEQQLGRSRMIRAASLLIRYVEELARTHSFSDQELEAQHLAALLILDEEQAVRQVATAYSHALSHSNQKGLSGASRAELSRLSSLTQELAPRIKQYENLVSYARIVQQLLTNTYPENSNLLRRSFPILDDLELSLPDDLVPTDEPIQSQNYPPLQTFEFEVATIAFELETEPQSLDIQLQPFEFEMATISGRFPSKPDIQSQIDALDEVMFPLLNRHWNANERMVLRGALENQTYDQIAQKHNQTPASLKSVGREVWKLLSSALSVKITKTNLLVEVKHWLWQRPIQRQQRQGQQFIEDLGNGIALEMVSIPAGSFLMGSPKNEPERSDNESPQHLVTVPSFLIGKYPITQAQHEAVVGTNPARFQGNNRPVETVSWKDAIAFCTQLSQKTGRPYRLPSEAEWEYACRANPVARAGSLRAGDAIGNGTITPFHFGETITTDLANYDGNYTYGKAPKGIYRKETTPVGSFPANAFGLYDMHGNVWEWCQDHWHSNYEGAPTDGSAWIDPKAEKDANRLLRGGSWYSNPRHCRSACRGSNNPGDRINGGFRVVCSA